MTKRLLVLAVLAAALAVPAVALADGGGQGQGHSKGTGPASANGALVGRNGAVLEVLSRRLDRQFQAFSTRCLVASPSEKCAKVANHYVRRLQRLSTWLQKMEAKIKEKCSAPNPPARCSSSADATARIDALVAKIATETAAIKAKFPNAGSTKHSTSSSTTTSTTG
jgi:hypothetical protein